MTDYQKLYALLFNAVTDALEEMEQMNFGRAKELLITAQQAAEAMAITKVTAMPIPSAVSVFLETPIKGQIP